MSLKYKIIVALTFILPTSAYLLINALFFSITPDLIIYAELDNLVVEAYEEQYLITGADEFNGYVVIVDDKVGAVVSDETVIKIGWRYYQVQDMQITERKLIEEAQGYKIPLSVIFTLIGAVIGVLIISGKMDLKRKNWRLATVIALWSLVGIIAVVDLIVSNIFGGIIVVSSSFTVYYIEHLIAKGKDEDGKLEQLKHLIGG